MAWRVLEYGDRRWTVSVAAERRANAPRYRLVFAFRSTVPERRALWADYPLESSSKAELFAQAERLTDDRLAQVLARELG